MNSPIDEQYNNPRPIVLIDKDNNRLELTVENIKLLRECTNEGFRNRALPLGLSCGFIAYTIMKRKGMMNSSNFSSIPIIVFSSIAGLIVGLRSYSSVCSERLMNAIKQNPKSVTEYPNNQVPLEKDHEIFTQSKPTDIEVTKVSDFDTMSNLDMDNQELPFESKTSDGPKHYTSYDELRERNRREYYNKVMQSGHEGKSNYNPVQPGFPPTQSWYSPSAQFGNLKQQYPPVATQQPEYSQQASHQNRDRVPVQPVNSEMTSTQGFERHSRQRKNEYGDDW